MNQSPFEWRTGQPSIFGGLQKEATITKRAVEKQGTRFRQDPVKLIKRPHRVVNRDGSGKTMALVKRIDFNAVRAYRMTGKTWMEVAVHFNCCQKAVLEQATRMFPELRRIRYGQPPGNKPKPIPLDSIIASMLAGESLRGVAKTIGMSHTSLRHRLMQSPEGMAALKLAKDRADAMNAAKKQAAQDRRNKCQFTEMGERDREALR